MIPLDDADLAIIDCKIIDIRKELAAMSANEKRMFDIICQLNEYVNAERAKVRDLECDIKDLQIEASDLQNEIDELQDELDES